MLRYCFWVVKKSLWILRLLLIVLIFGFVPFVSNLIMWLIPSSISNVIKILIQSKEGLSPSRRRRPKKVAVIGGGIAGVGASWGIATSGEAEFIEVHLYESSNRIGGNCFTHEWKPKPKPKGAESEKEGTDDEQTIRTGASFMYWSPDYFKNYELLLQHLEIPVRKVFPKFFISHDHKTATFSQGHSSKDGIGINNPNARWIEDMFKWDKCVRWVRECNGTCGDFTRWGKRILRLVGIGHGKIDGHGVGTRTFYEVPLLNPLNVIPAKCVALWLFGVSREFWEQVVVPVYSSHFHTTQLDGIPGCVLPSLDDYISVGDDSPLQTLHTWESNPEEVFNKMAQQILKGNDGNRIILQADITEVFHAKSESAAAASGGSGDVWTVVHKGGLTAEHYDEVIFACPATEVDRLTKIRSSRAFRSLLFNNVVPNVQYEPQGNSSCSTVIFHTNAEAVFPPHLLRHLSHNQFTNYVRVNGKEVENTFSLGCWVPAAVDTASNWESYPSMLVTYNPFPETRKAIGEENIQREMKGAWANPQFTADNMILAYAFHLLQGRCSAYYCGSYVTPGNGHDMSFVSGLVLAEQVAGKSAYPFDWKCPAKRDFALLRAFMGF